MRHDNGGDLLVTVLRELGIDTVFGIVSVHNLPLVEAVDRELRFVPVRHEASAVNAADAYGRARGTLGCALTSHRHRRGQRRRIADRGAQRGQLRTARHRSGGERVPGQRTGIHPRDQGPARHAPGRLRVRRERAGRRAGRPDPARGGPLGPDRARRPRQRRVADRPPVRRADRRTRRARGGAPAAPAESELAAAGALLASARRPLVWAGGGANTARGELARLLEATGAGLITSNSGRGSVPEDHPQVIGNFATTPAVRALLADADVLLTVGTHFRSNETADYTLELPDAHIQIDVDAGGPRPGLPGHPRAAR